MQSPARPGAVGRMIIIAVLYLAMASGFAKNSLADCQQTEIVPYPESHGWARLYNSCGGLPRLDWITASQQLSQAEVCANRPNYAPGAIVAKAPDGSPVCAYPSQINTNGVARGCFDYLLFTPFCRNPDTNLDSPIYTGPIAPITPGPCWTVRCVDRRYTIKLSTPSGVAESATILTSVEPIKKTVNLTAKVFDNNGQLVPNAKVKLVVDVQLYSGGHQHDNDRNTKQMGQLSLAFPSTGTVTQNGKVLEGNTLQDGLRFTFTAPAPSGDHKITASCTDGKNCTTEGPDTVWVGVKDLVPLPGSDSYVLLPNVNDPKHPDNHYMTYTAMLRVTALAALYHGQFPDDPLLHLNDASLERGGVFDIKYEGRSIWWTSPHFEHCRGTEVDIRANLSDGAIPESNFPEFDRIAKRVGADPVRECKADENKQCIVSTRHYHVRLTGGKPKCP